MADLKPCPFCGGTATIQHRESENTTLGRVEIVFVRCSSCWCQTGQYKFFPWIIKRENAESAAVKAWNRRDDNDEGTV